MNTINTLITYITSTLHSDDEGASMVEYGLLVAFIALVAVIGVTAAGVQLDALFDKVTTGLGG